MNKIIAIDMFTENLSSFVRWIAELVQKRNWVSLLLVVDVGLVVALKPKGGVLTWFLKENFNFEPPGWYQSSFWLFIGGIFLAAIAIAIKTMPRAANLEVKEGAERKVIKGLRPDAIKRMNEWRKDFTASFSSHEIETLQRLSDAADRLWKQHAELQAEVRRLTAIATASSSSSSRGGIAVPAERR